MGTKMEQILYYKNQNGIKKMSHWNFLTSAFLCCKYYSLKEREPQISVSGPAMFTSCKCIAAIK